VLASSLAWLVGALCVLFTLRRLRRVRELEEPALPALALEQPGRERLLAKLPAGSPLGDVAREVLEQPSRRAAVAVLNEALGDVARELDVSAEVPKSATRVALAAGGFFGLIELARRLPDEGVSGAGTALGAFGGGVVAAMICLALARSARERAFRCRNGWDRLSRALERLLPDESQDVGAEKNRGIEGSAE
jgi:hypothetical protein